MRMRVRTKNRDLRTLFETVKFKFCLLRGPIDLRSSIDLINNCYFITRFVIEIFELLMLLH